MTKKISSEQALAILNELFAASPRTLRVEVGKGDTELSIFLEGDSHLKTTLLQTTPVDSLLDRVRQNPPSRYHIPPEVRYFLDGTAYVLFVRNDAPLR